MGVAEAAYRVEEEQLWKCSNHPSKRRRHGVCPSCLRDRLVTLCRNCGNVRPCPCYALSSASSSSSSSSNGGEPSFGRSLSLSIPFFLRSDPSRFRTKPILSVFRRSKSKKGGDAKNEVNRDNENFESNDKIEDFARMISRSRSVVVGTRGKTTSGLRPDDVSSSACNGKFWNLKAFRSSKTPKAVNRREHSSFNKA